MDDLNLRVASKFHFRATIDGEQISFSEISGLDVETEVIEYRRCDSETFTTEKRAGLVKTSNLVMKKGIFADDDRLLELFNRIFDKEYYTDASQKMDILIELLDEEGDTVMTWNIIGAFPVKMTGTDLKSDANEVAIESLEFAHEGILTTLQG